MSRAFHALDLDVPSGEILEVLKGTGGLTEARTSTIYQPDWEDIWRGFGSGEPAWCGGRKVENLLLHSNDITQSEWEKAGASPPTADDFETVTFGANVSSHLRQKITTSAVIGDTHSFRAELKGTDGEKVKFALFRNDGVQVGKITVTLTVEWVEYSTSFTATQAGTVWAGLSAFDTNENTVNIRNSQGEDTTGQTDTTSSEFVPTTTAAAHKIFGTDRSGVPLASLPWLYGGPAATNEFTYSRDLTNAAWTASGAVTRTYDQVGLGGAVNTATYLEDDDAAGYEAVLENVTIADDSNTHVWRYFIKKDADETRFPRIDATLINGTTQNVIVHVNTATGAININQSSGTVAVEVNDEGDWWEVLLSVENNTSGNLTARTIIYPAGGSIFGTSDPNAVGSAIIGQVEFHINKEIAQVRGSTPLFTAGSTVTVDATDLSFDDANHVDLEGAWYCEFKNVGVDTNNLGGLLGVGTNGRFLYGKTNGLSISSVDGTTVLSGPPIVLAADDTEYKIGLAYGDSLYRINTDDVWGTAAAYDGAWDNTEGKIRVVAAVSTTAVPVTVMLLRNLRRYDLSYDKAQTAIDGMMNGVFPSEGLVPYFLNFSDFYQFPKVGEL